jgi:hypothetical protein
MDNNNENQQLFFTLDEVRSKIYGNHICKSTMLNMVKANKIPVVRMMSRYFVPKWWVDEQIKAATEKPVEMV